LNISNRGEKGILFDVSCDIPTIPINCPKNESAADMTMQDLKMSPHSNPDVITHIVASKPTYVIADIMFDMEASAVDDGVEGSKYRSTLRRTPTFITFAKDLINLTSTGAVRLRKYYLNRASLETTDQLIGRSNTSEVFRGFLDERPVAVKRIRMDVVQNSCSRKELKDLLTEIDILSRLSTHSI
jgi:hypothetical protein